VASPERIAQIIRLFAPIAVGLILIVGGLLIPNFGVLALGAGALGIPGAVGGKAAE
jgi:hypothetical protein